MRLVRPAVAFLATLIAAAAQPALPRLDVEATDGGSVLRVRNSGASPLTAWLIELVDYPGSSFALYQEESGRQPLAPGAERRVPIVNMTVGAAPEYVKMQAALFADGSAAGSPEKVSQLRALRNTTIETTRELIGRLQKGASPADLRSWADSIPQPTKRDRGTPAAITRSTTRELILTSAGQLEKSSKDALLAELQGSEKALAAGTGSR